jgi:DNA-binding transcriptional MerR regulator
MYSSEAVEQVRLIRSALAVGFTIAELSRIFKTRNAGGAPCQDVRAMAYRKLKDLEDNIHEMLSLRRELKRVLRRWDKMLKAAGPGQKAHLLQILVSRKSKGAAQ